MKDKPKILVVDDDSALLAGTCRILDNAGYKTLKAECGRDCLAIMRLENPALVLLDVKLPDMDGLEVCRFLKANPAWEEVFVVFLSAMRTGSDEQADGMDAGADGYIARPVGNRELLARVEGMFRLRESRIALREEKRRLEVRTSELEESELRYRNTFEQAAVGMVHYEIGGRFLRFNSRFCQIVGYSEKKISGITWQEITHTDDLEADLAYLEELLRGKISTYSMDKRFIRKNGSIVWTRLTVSAARDGSGKTQYLIGVVEDISERKSAEEKLRDSETLMRGIISSMPTLLLAIDEDGRVVFWNAECERVTGFGAEEVVGADDVWGRLMPDMFGLQSVSEIFGGKDGEFRNVEYEIRDKSGGKRYISWSRATVKIPILRDAIWIVGVDVTDRKNADALRKEASELQAFNRAMVDRENRIIELKETINRLSKELGREPPHPPIWEDPELLEAMSSDARLGNEEPDGH